MVDDKIGLTPKQREVYDFIVMYNQAYGVFPSVREIMAGKIQESQIIVSRSSPASVQRIITEIENRGWVRRAAARSRALQLL
jgi:SOS-response transcriptional repressor LexA